MSETVEFTFLFPLPHVGKLQAIRNRSLRGGTVIFYN